MAAAITNAVADLQTKALSLSGVKAAPAQPVEAFAPYPFAVSYPHSGNVDFESAGFGFFYHTIITEFHVENGILAQASALVQPYIESFPSKVLSDPKLSNTVNEVRAIRYEYGNLPWADTVDLGIRFFVDVKITLT